ncbi:glycosyltransferase [Sulfitobacter sp. S190]|uniref:glycosyltransferase n=1 Tax=Sulfitobacter sp. S190 TaxID=2867022 RepID=UPI0021A5AB49|nr:glycosyltransferase [Sulfitobacter sp. S190]UWR24423.1 glycosyltransferase [Sulfitobacter sp. S190]
MAGMLERRIKDTVAFTKRAADALKRRRLQGPYRGYVDGPSDENAIRGWVVHRESRKGNQAVGLFAGDTLLETCTANIIREDVRAASGADPDCGFQFTLTDSLFDRIAQSDGVLTVRTVGAAEHVIGTVRLDVDRSDPVLEQDEMARCAHVLTADLEALDTLLAQVPEDEPVHTAHRAPPLTNHGKMFTTERVIPDIPESGQPAYLDYVRYRYRMDEHYAVEPGLESAERYLYWYMTAYRGQERRRIPLANETIEHLNETLVMAGQTHSLTRAMWWRMSGRPDLLGRFNFNDRDSYLDALFWWAHQDVTHMYFEDVLVPDRHADLLRGVHPSRRLDAWPLSYFTERFYKDSAQLHFIRPGTAEGRKTLLLAMLVRAARRPDLLRYIPRTSIRKLLEADADGVSDLDRFVTAIRSAQPQDENTPEDSSAVPLSYDRYAAALRRVFFDLDSFTFLTRSPAGDRFEAAALPRPETGERVDVQLIGPLAKASGLGQATRLSADILRSTGLQVRGVDFDLDNPAPEGFSTETMIEPYGPAKINLIHLNAESTPLAFAYQPDVFSGSYNIGYFFWELDQPANCHYLGMELLDEIWVSTQYGVDIYKADAKDKPVVNVGMCFEEMPDITREDARDFVERRFRFDDSHYVCLVAFDSFSFVQRKNPVSVLQAFQKAFDGVAQARLVVKTQNRDNVFDPVQVQLWDRVEAIIANDPRIVVMNETLSYRNLLRLKAGSDCYISLHKSEGWGFGMIEAMALGVPVLATAYSGNMDFCTEDTTWLVDYEIVDLKQGDYIFVRPGAQWAEPSVAHAATQMRAAFDNPDLRKSKADAALSHIRKNFSREAIAQRYGDRLNEILKDVD